MCSSCASSVRKARDRRGPCGEPHECGGRGSRRPGGRGGSRLRRHLRVVTRGRLNAAGTRRGTRSRTRGGLLPAGSIPSGSSATALPQRGDGGYREPRGSTRVAAPRALSESHRPVDEGEPRPSRVRTDTSRVGARWGPRSTLSSGDRAELREGHRPGRGARSNLRWVPQPAPRDNDRATRVRGLFRADGRTPRSE